MSNFSIDWWESLWVQIPVIIAITIASCIFIKYLCAFLHKKMVDNSCYWDDAIVSALKSPIIYLIIIIGAWLVWNRISAVYFTGVHKYTNQLFDIVMLVGIIWILMRFIHFLKNNLLNGIDGRPKPDVTTVHALSKVGQLAVVAIGALGFMGEFGIPISGLVAFGGGTAVVIGIAAKDLIANFFGGMLIVMDKPFKVGDWVRSPDQNIEGTVEYIGWRHTRIRTFDKRPLYVPNSIFTTVSIENPSRMQNRRIKFTIGVRYDDMNKVADIVKDIKDYLSNHDAIDQNPTWFVNLTEFGASSVNILVYAFTKTRVWVEYQEIQQEIMLGISDIVSKSGAEFAFPTQTLDIPDAVMIKNQS